MRIGNRPAFSTYASNAMPASKSNMTTFDSDTLKKYFSQLDVELYFGNYYVDEIVHIKYSVRQNNLPIFGYNSYVYDSMAMGNRIIEGSFAINFTRPRYLFELMEHIRADGTGKDGNLNINKPREGLLEEQSPAPAAFRQRERKPLFNTLFDIDIMYGQDTSLTKATHLVIEGVSIMECAQELDMSGQPIIERYSFLARDISPVE